MNFLRDAQLDRFSLAGSARQLLAETRELTGAHVESLKSQLEDLWRTAEDMLPPVRPADLYEHVERALEDLGAWKAIGLQGKFAT